MADPGAPERPVDPDPTPPAPEPKPRTDSRPKPPREGKTDRMG